MSAHLGLQAALYGENNYSQINFELRIRWYDESATYRNKNIHVIRIDFEKTE